MMESRYPLLATIILLQAIVSAYPQSRRFPDLVDESSSGTIRPGTSESAAPTAIKRRALMVEGTLEHYVNLTGGTLPPDNRLDLTAAKLDSSAFRLYGQLACAGITESGHWTLAEPKQGSSLHKAQLYTSNEGGYRRRLVVIDV